MLNKAQLPVTVYTIKVWLSAVVITPALYVGASAYTDPRHDPSGLLGYPGLVFIELIFSGPAWLALYLVTRVLAPHVGYILLKTILTAIGFGLTILTFIWFDWFWGLKPENGMSQWMWGNALLIATATWVFKLPPQVPMAKTQFDKVPPPGSNDSFSDASGNY